MAIFDNAKISIKNPDGTYMEIGKVQDLNVRTSVQPIREIGGAEPDYLHPGVAMMTTDMSLFRGGTTQSFSMNGVDWGNSNAIGMIKESIKGTKHSFKIESDFEKIDPRTITVMVQGVFIDKSEYSIDTNGTLIFKHYLPGYNGNIDMQAKIDDEQYMIRNKVLILATSKMTPFHRLEEFAPDLFDELSIERLMKYPDNKRHETVFEASPDGKVYVLGYTIEKRGIYAKVKVYQDLY